MSIQKKIRLLDDATANGVYPSQMWYSKGSGSIQIGSRTEYTK